MIFQIAALSPADINHDETLSTLRYGKYVLVRKYCTLGVPAMSWILAADSQKLSLLILRKVPFLIF